MTAAVIGSTAGAELSTYAGAGVGARPGEPKGLLGRSYLFGAADSAVAFARATATSSHLLVVAPSFESHILNFRF